MTHPSTKPHQVDLSSADHASVRYAVLGATGLVGGHMLALLHRAGVQPDQVVALASERSAGREVAFGDAVLTVQAVSRDAFEGIDIVLASAGGDRSREWLPIARDAGCVCIDNSSAFRMDEGIPLVVPEVNADALGGIEIGKGAIIANPNCSTIQLVVALDVIRRAAGLERVVVSTYQSISGAGLRTMEEFREASVVRIESGGANAPAPDGPRRVPAFDVLPLIGDPDPATGETSEETKMVQETPKILGEAVPVDVTCVRVPVFIGHAESVLVETKRALSVDEAREALAAAPGVKVWSDDDPVTPARVAGDDDVHVSRIRRANGFENGLHMWVVADNLRKGAAWNAVQIAAEVVHRSKAKAGV